MKIYYDCVDTPDALYMRGTRGTPLVWSSCINEPIILRQGEKDVTGEDTAGKDISIKITGIS
ncbi:hypothetical protein [Companilactobacillus bobalius]|uniref:hypothetical protein n=1 Tax=Companilactobacillus bobalius TaxID=2801451 RepID=UPI0013022ACB|nr:hypothetical protein [Companilactobacillus bobalius]KAE9560632.1 hypothetical protein ATN92_10880 [Companilactobacillus bobalius]